MCVSVFSVLFPRQVCFNLFLIVLVGLHWEGKICVVVQGICMRVLSLKSDFVFW